MIKQKTWVPVFFLLFLPLSLFAPRPMSGEPKNDPARYFSLSIDDTPAAQTIPAWAVSQAPAPSTPPAPEKFTFRSLTCDFLKDAGEIWSYPVPHPDPGYPADRRPRGPDRAPDRERRNDSSGDSWIIGWATPGSRPSARRKQRVRDCSSHTEYLLFTRRSIPTIGTHLPGAGCKAEGCPRSWWC